MNVEEAFTIIHDECTEDIGYYNTHEDRYVPSLSAPVYLRDICTRNRKMGVLFGANVICDACNNLINYIRSK